MHSLPTRSRLSSHFLGLSLGIALALGLATSAQAQWQWRDAKGSLQFSDLPPPPGTPDKDIIKRPANQKTQRIEVVPFGQSAASAAPLANPGTAASAPSKADQERQSRLKQQDKDAQAKQKVDDARLAEQRRENCSRAQDNLKLLQEGVRLKMPNERGEPVVLEGQQRADEIQRNRTVISTECR